MEDQANRTKIGDEVIIRALFRNGERGDIVSEVSKIGFATLRDFRRWSTFIKVVGKSWDLLEKTSVSKKEKKTGLQTSVSHKSQFRWRLGGVFIGKDIVGINKGY